MYGFHKRILKIDMTRKTATVEPLTDETCRAYLGGKGLAGRLLLDNTPAGVDPLAPENALIFATGPCCGTLVWGGSRYGVFTKSPLTGGYLESYSGGKAPEAVDAAGYDAVVITGKADIPTALTISPEGCTFHDCSDLWGMETFDTEDKARELYASGQYKRKGAVVIGPAGERLNRFSIIANDKWRCAGRGGAGAVMGSKMLKAIVFEGDAKRTMASPEELSAYCKNFLKEGRETPGAKAYKAQGTTMMVALMNTAEAFPGKYWRQGTVDHWETLSGEYYHKEHDVKPNACLKCFMACGRKGKLSSGQHKGLEIEGPEYETIYAFGGLCMVEDIADVVYLNHLCDILGVDTITAGNLCGLIMEAVEQERLDWPVRYGSAEDCARLVTEMALGEGQGAILSKGIVEVAKELDLEDLAIHVKGMEPPGYDPRKLKGVGLGYGVSDRGACHLRATFYKPELAGMIAPDAIDGKAELFLDFEDRLTLFDTFILCRFYRDMYTWEELIKVINLVTGAGYDKDSLRKVAFEATNLAREFNIREGKTPKDDLLPERFHTDPLETGHVLKKNDYMTMLRDYYDLKGWDATELE